MLSNILPLDQKISFANIIRAIRASFALAALFSVFMVVCIGSFIDEGESDFRTIDLAGVQRTLSQKLAKDIYFTGIEGPPITQIKKDAELWDSIHNVLRYGSAELGIPKPENPVIVRLFDEISPYQEKLYRSALGKDPAKPGVPEYTDIRQWEHRFLAGTDRIVNELRADAEKGIADLKYMVAFLMSLFLLFIFGLYRILVKPIIKMVRSLSEERKERAEQVRSILENTSDLIWSLDLEYNLLTFNSAFSKAIEARTGTAPEIGRPILLDPYPGEILRKWEPLYEKAFSGQDFSSEIRSELEGDTSYIEVSFNPIYGAGGRVTGCNVFGRDVSERAETHKRLVRSEKYLKEAQGIANLATGTGTWAATEYIGRTNRTKCSDRTPKPSGPITGASWRSYTPTIGRPSRRMWTAASKTVRPTISCTVS